MKIVLLAALLLPLSMCKTHAAADCARATQHAGSIEELVRLAASVGITMTAKDRAEYASCFNKRPPDKRKQS